MDFLEVLRTSFNNLKSHKLRSFLTTLGIIIGITAVLANVAVVQGFSSFFKEQVEGLGSNFVSIQAGENRSFDDHVYDSLSGSVYLEGSTASRSGQGIVKYMGDQKSLVISGVKSGYFDARDLGIVEGSTLRRQDESTVVVSSSLAENEFDKPILEMSTIEITLMKNGYEPVTRRFKVKGISEDPSSFAAMQPDVYLPVSTFNEMTGQEGYSSISLFAKSDEYVDAVKSQAIETLDRLLKVEPEKTIEEEKERVDVFDLEGQATTFEEATTEEREEYTIQTQEDVLSFVDEITGTINLLFIGIASVSLLVGGIGIANIMIVSVTERTREIGVMKAVGAKNRDILSLFLIESGLIGLLGGIVGLSLAYLVANLFVPILIGVQGIIPIEWVGLSIGISLMIGIISGLYPARRASKMDPVEALSYE